MLFECFYDLNTGITHLYQLTAQWVDTSSILPKKDVMGVSMEQILDFATSHAYIFITRLELLLFP